MKIHAVQAGFTLIELIVAVVVLGFVAILGGPVLQVVFDSYLTETRIQEVDSRARHALERLVRELRGARLASLGAGGGLTSLTFTDQDGTSVLYNLASGNLQRTTGGVARVLADGVTVLTFDVVTTAATPSIRVVAAFTQGNQVGNFESLVYPRNP